MNYFLIINATVKVKVDSTDSDFGWTEKKKKRPKCFHSSAEKLGHGLIEVEYAGNIFHKIVQAATSSLLLVDVEITVWKKKKRSSYTEFWDIVETVWVDVGLCSDEVASAATERVLKMFLTSEIVFSIA